MIIETYFEEIKYKIKRTSGNIKTVLLKQKYIKTILLKCFWEKIKHKIKNTSGRSVAELTTCTVWMSSSDWSSFCLSFRWPLPFDLFLSVPFFLRLFCRSSSCSRASFIYLSDDARPEKKLNLLLEGEQEVAFK